VAAALLSLAMATGCARTLTCHHPFAADPGATHRITLTGSEVAMAYGVNSGFGMVGTTFVVRDPGVPGSAVDLCEARSAAGAGWQHSTIVETPGGDEMIFNQAAGNAVGYQWGHGSPVERRQTPRQASLEAARWIPCYFDTRNGHPASPCDGTSGTFTACKPAITATLEPVPGHGDVIRLTRTTTFRATVDQAWKLHFPLDAFYLDRSVARATEMAVFMQGGDGWQLGPVAPYEGWTAADLEDGEGIARGVMNPTPPWGGSWSNINREVDQIVWVSTVGEKRVACGIKGLPSGLSLRMVETVYCGDATDDACGSVDVIIFHPQDTDVTWREGSERTFRITLHIGTTAQLRAMGYYCR
jgi:hypothetical protein